MSAVVGLRNAHPLHAQVFFPAVTFWGLRARACDSSA